MPEREMIELLFPVMGSTVPADHGYALYSAICHYIPKLHEMANVQVAGLVGTRDGSGGLTLPAHPRLRIRLQSTEIHELLPLAGKSLELNGRSIRLGIPNTVLIQPALHLRARLVVIKKFQEPLALLDAAMRQLTASGISAHLAIPPDGKGEPQRKVMRIHDFTVVGFTVDAVPVTEADSIMLQATGLGGKRKMGCGVFLPVRRGKT